MLEPIKLRDDAWSNGDVGHRRTVTPRSKRPTPLQTARWTAVQKAERKGLSIRGIALELGMHRDAVREYMSPIVRPFRVPAHPRRYHNLLAWQTTEGTLSLDNWGTVSLSTGTPAVRDLTVLNNAGAVIEIPCASPTRACRRGLDRWDGRGGARRLRYWLPLQLRPPSSRVRHEFSPPLQHSPRVVGDK